MSPHTDKKFGTAIGCMDGRVIPVLDAFMREQFGVDFVDQPTLPGPDKILAESDEAEIENMKKKIDISVNGHGSKVIAVVGHQLCAGNPVSDEEHREHLKKAAAVVRSWGFDTKVVTLWVNIDKETQLGVAEMVSELSDDIASNKADIAQACR